MQAAWPGVAARRRTRPAPRSGPSVVNRPEPSEGYGLPEELAIGNLRAGLFASAESDGTCDIRLVPILKPFVPGEIELANPDPPVECPAIKLSEDGSTVLTYSTTQNPSGTPIHRFDFYRTADGSLLRTTTRTSAWTTPPILDADGSAAVATFADNEQLQGSVTEVIGAKVNADRLFVLSDDLGRKCRVSDPLGSIRNRAVAIGCRYPDGTSRVGRFNIDSSEVWLSQPVPLFAEIASLSPAGDQLLFLRATGTPGLGWPFVPFEPPALEISVTDVGGDGAILPLMPMPEGFAGYLFFTPP